MTTEFDPITAKLIARAAKDCYRNTEKAGLRTTKFVQSGNEVYRVMVQQFTREDLDAMAAQVTGRYGE